MANEALVEKPTRGVIKIEWIAVGDPDEAGEYRGFDWKLDMDPPGLTDDEVARVLTEAAERL